MRGGDLKLGGADAGVLPKNAEQVSKCDYPSEEENYDDEKDGEKGQECAPWAQVCPAHREFVVDILFFSPTCPYIILLYRLPL